MNGWLRSLAGPVLGAVLVMLFTAGVFGDEAMSRDEGKQLYQKKCSGCHGEFESRAKGGRSMNRILSAIRTLHQHKQCSSLTDGEILLIALALKEVKD